MTDLGPILRSFRCHRGPFMLLVMEVAMGMAVLVHLLAMGSNFFAVAYAGSGLDEDNLIYVTRRFPGRAEPEPDASAQAARDLALLSKVEGVVGAVLVDELPLPHKEALPTVLRSEGPVESQRSAVAWPLRASAGVVATLGLVQVEGGDFAHTPPETTDARRALLTESLARRLFPLGGVVGQMLEGEGLPRARVVGVVRDFRVRMPFLPEKDSVVVLEDVPVSAYQLTFVARSAPGQRGPVMQRIAVAVDGATSTAPPVTIQTPGFDETPRFHTVFRGAALVILWTCAIVLGVTLFGSLAMASFSVAERTRQIGVRRALGATRGQIVGYFLLENALVTSVGLGIGLVLALVLNLPVRGLMPTMALTATQIATAMVVFLLAGLLSALFPALRAARIPPTAATRSL
jgi:putative ABC transport system permease protein